MNIYGYARVSTTDQNCDRQIYALEQAGVDSNSLYADKLSGKDFNRPRYKALIRKLKKGDLLIVKSIDRLGRDYEEIQRQWRRITKDIGADICVIDMPLLDTRRDKDLMGTFISDLVLQILSFVAQNERDNIKQRQAEGIARAHEKGVKFGRPARDLPDNFTEAVILHFNQLITGTEAAEMCELAISTYFYNYKKHSKRILTEEGILPE